MYKIELIIIKIIRIILIAPLVIAYIILEFDQRYLEVWEEKCKMPKVKKT